MVLPVAETIDLSEIRIDLPEQKVQEGIMCAIVKITAVSDVSPRTNAVFGSRKLDTILDEPSVIARFADIERAGFQETKLSEILNGNNACRGNVSTSNDTSTGPVHSGNVGTINKPEKVQTEEECIVCKVDDLKIKKSADEELKINQACCKLIFAAELDAELDTRVITKKGNDFFLIEYIKDAYIERRFKFYIARRMIEAVLLKNKEINYVQTNSSVKLNHLELDLKNEWLLVALNKNETHERVSIDFGLDLDGLSNVTPEYAQNHLISSKWQVFSDNINLWHGFENDETNGQVDSKEENECLIPLFMYLDKTEQAQDLQGEMQSHERGEGEGREEREESENRENRENEGADEKEASDFFELISRSKNHILFISNGITYFFLHKKMERKKKSKKKRLLWKISLMP